MVSGAFRFTLASLVVYATVAFGEGWMYENLGRSGAYAAWTILFIGLGAYSLQNLVRETMQGFRFTLIFSLSFLLYAIGWIACYFSLGGGLGEWLGSLAGSVLLSLGLALGFGRFARSPIISIVIFTLHSAGYFLGDIANNIFPRPTGMLLWGLAYGIGLGAALGAALFILQSSRDSD